MSFFVSVIQLNYQISQIDLKIKFIQAPIAGTYLQYQHALGFKKWAGTSFTRKFPLASPVFLGCLLVGCWDLTFWAYVACIVLGLSVSSFGRGSEVGRGSLAVATRSELMSMHSQIFREDPKGRTPNS